MSKKKVFALAVSVCLFALPACQVFNPPEPTPEPTPTPVPLKELNICLGYEPASLYPLAAHSQAARDVLQAIYDGPIDSLNSQPVPVILDDLPSLSNGGVALTPVDVKAGDTVINTAGNPVALRSGTRVFPSGCDTPACAITWDGSSPLQLDQPTATFRLKAGLKWSDGQPLAASDSVYGYRLAADPDSPTNKRAVDQTAAYRALDEVAVEWVGMPGLVTDAYEEYFWMPLPEHAWGLFTAGELLEAEEPSRKPLGWGAYRVTEWLPGEEIRLERNSFYFRADEGLPLYDLVNFRFTRFDSADEIQNSGRLKCDIITPSAADAIAMNVFGDDTMASDFQLLLKSASRVEVLAFGINPASYDLSYYPYGEDRPDIFGDVRVRQAFAYCIDRAGISSSLQSGTASVSDSFLHPENAFLSGVQLPSYGYNPERGRALLEETGWMDYDQNPATPRTSFGTVRIPPNTALQIEMYVSDALLSQETAKRVAEDLAECGVSVTVTGMPASELYQPAPEGAVFGRAFDLALMTWEVGPGFTCEWFTTAEIPKESNNWMGQVTGGWNLTGFSSADYDAACDLFSNAGADGALRRAEADGMLQQLSADLPIIPLFHFADAYLVREGLCGLVWGLEANSVFVGIEDLSESGSC